MQKKEKGKTWFSDDTKSFSIKKYLEKDFQLYALKSIVISEYRRKIPTGQPAQTTKGSAEKNT